MLRKYKFLLSLIIALIPCASYGQEAAKNQVFVLDDFSNGIATKPSEIGLPKGYATVAENLRVGTEQGSLVKRDQILGYGTADATEAITGAARLYLKSGTKALVVSHGDEIEVGNDTTGAFTNILNLSTGNYRWQFQTWHDILIGTDGYNQPIKWDGSSASATYLGSCLGTALTTGGGPSGTYTYKISFYTSTYEVLFDVASNPVVVSNKDVSLSMIPIAPDTYLGEDIIGRKVYRIENGGTTYKLLTNGTIANNTATTLTDSDSDAEITGRTAYPTVNNTTVFSCTPPKGKLLLVHKNRLWIANNPNFPSRAYYSDDGSHDYFDSLGYFNIRQDDGDEITFIKNVLGILTISKNNTIQKLYTDGDDPAADWPISDPFSFVGCKAPYSAVNTPEGVLFLSFDGIYRFNGQHAILISDAITPTIKDILESNFVNCWGEYHKNTYYLAYPSKATGIATNNRILVYDMINKSFTTDLLNVNVFCTFNSGTDWDVLYSGSSVDGKVSAHSGMEYEVVHRRHSDFSGTWDDARYVPTGVPGGDADSPVIELGWTETIDDLTNPINSYTTSIIDRPDTDGSYTSQVLDLGASAFDKIYWNEDLNTYGNIELGVRSAATAASCPTATLSTMVSNPAGSDISTASANRFVQYYVSMSTSSINYSPELYKNSNYVVKLTYFKEATRSETTIPFRWNSGWLDFAPGYKKLLRKIDVYYKSEGAGTLTISVDNYEGTRDSFSINLVNYPDHYSEYFSNSAFLGELFKVLISEDSLNTLSIKRLVITYDIEPMV